MFARISSLFVILVLVIPFVSYDRPSVFLEESTDALRSADRGRRIKGFHLKINAKVKST
jgi:hypothetical protein